MGAFAINNMPEADALWRGIGGYFDSLGEILCEFIDNSISNYKAHPEVLNRTILIKFKAINPDRIHVLVADSGTGIKDLNAAFTLGSHAGAETLLNEHGFGFKHALASANPENDDWRMITCTKEDAAKGQFSEIKAPYRLGDYEGDKVVGSFCNDLGQTGTVVEFSCSRKMFMTIRNGMSGNWTRLESVINVLKEDLGFKYSGILSDGGVSIKLVLEDNSGGLSFNEFVKPIVPEWEYNYDPKPDTEEYDLGNGTVKINYRFGKIYDHSETQKYYKKNMSNSGVEIRINGRLLDYNIIKPIWEIEPHNIYNQFLGVINLVSDDANRLPKTKTSKNGLREGDEQLENLFAWIRTKLPILPKNDTPKNEDLDELELFKRLKAQKETVLASYHGVVLTELNAYSKLNEKIRIDLYEAVNGQVTIYEGKKDKTKVLDVYQLLMYWDGLVYDGNPPTKGILISAEHPDSVKKIVNIINSMKDANGNNYNIEMKTWKDENIDYPV